MSQHERPNASVDRALLALVLMLVALPFLLAFALAKAIKGEG